MAQTRNWERREVGEELWSSTAVPPLNRVAAGIAQQAQPFIKVSPQFYNFCQQSLQLKPFCQYLHLFFYLSCAGQLTHCIKIMVKHLLSWKTTRMFTQDSEGLRGKKWILPSVKMLSNIHISAFYSSPLSQEIKRVKIASEGIHDVLIILCSKCWICVK